MKRLIPLAVAMVILGGAQEPSADPRERRMGDGRTQFEHILENDYERSLADTDEIVKLAAELKEELDKNDHRILSSTPFARPSASRSSPGTSRSA